MGPRVEIILGRWSAELARHCTGSLVPESLTITVVEKADFHSKDTQFREKNAVYSENHSKCRVL